MGDTLIILLSLTSSTLGSLIALAIWFHWDIEGFWEQRRLEHGKKLDQRQLEAARKHGYKTDY
jgi:hypothetical protein